jgi:hypothetical protein
VYRYPCGAGIQDDLPQGGDMNEYTVLLTWDEEAAKWYAVNDDIPVILEDASLDRLIGRVKMATPELLELNGRTHTDIRLLFKMERQAVIA